LRVGIGGPVGSGKTALVEAATFSPELADLTMTAPSIESRRDAQHAHCARHAGT
jgi:Ni2+-binding GTPase involved in maturation of urease and hydrogenase